MKIVCIVQARMGSERLPGKVIKPIFEKPMILYTLDRLSKSRYIDDIVLATSVENRENPLVDIVSSAGYNVFRGNESNVLKRYKDASDKHSGDIIIRVTGDCPFVDPVIVDNVITYFEMNQFDYVRLDVPESFIRGFDVEIFTKESLDKVYDTVSSMKVDKSDKNSLEMYKEHVTYYMYKHPDQFKIGYVKGSDFYNKEYRLCVDTSEDFKLVEHVYDHFKNEHVSSKQIVEYIDKNPELCKINYNVKQK
ncbi:cytidylyltransferase domain-containing protein [Clostridium tyrobutyricum]|uniref:cytidylyltransferase domain-containing protein n=1 Tax=Clostridium tyrobutyricum TaxID=1519 RepID=UPI0002FBA5EC|nr:glycosyltransferase family protein [Clostridium tyrobutyricum]